MRKDSNICTLTICASALCQSGIAVDVRDEQPPSRSFQVLLNHSRYTLQRRARVHTDYTPSGIVAGRSRSAPAMASLSAPVHYALALVRKHLRVKKYATHAQYVSIPVQYAECAEAAVCQSLWWWWNWRGFFLFVYFCYRTMGICLVLAVSACVMSFRPGIAHRTIDTTTTAQLRAGCASSQYDDDDDDAEDEPAGRQRSNNRQPERESVFVLDWIHYRKCCSPGAA